MTAQTHAVTGSNVDTLAFAFEGTNLRVIRDEANEPWFVAADVCAALGLRETHKVISRLDDDEKGRNSIPTLGGRQDMSVVNEFGLYSLILTSRKAGAKKFKRWVTHEVLPAIRKTGQYTKPSPNPLDVISPNCLPYLGQKHDRTAFGLYLAALESRVFGLTPTARKFSVSPGTLETLGRFRLKDLERLGRDSGWESLVYDTDTLTNNHKP